MSHPRAIFPRYTLRISRNRRRIRFRRTAFPNPFLMLHPNRLMCKPFARRKTVNSRLVRRRPSLYTASYSARCTSRQARGNLNRAASDSREAVTPFPAATCKDFSAPWALHACAKAVLLMTASHMRLIRPLRQRCFSSIVSVIAPLTKHRAGALLSHVGSSRHSRIASDTLLDSIRND